MASVMASIALHRDLDPDLVGAPARHEPHAGVVRHALHGRKDLFAQAEAGDDNPRRAAGRDERDRVVDQRDLALEGGLDGRDRRIGQGVHAINVPPASKKAGGRTAAVRV